MTTNDWNFPLLPRKKPGRNVRELRKQKNAAGALSLAFFPLRNSHSLGNVGISFASIPTANDLEAGARNVKCQSESTLPRYKGQSHLPEDLQ